MQPERSQCLAPPSRLTRRSTPRVVLALAFCLASASTATGRETAPSDELLRLVPADSVLVATIDDLREQSRALLDSRLARELQKLPAFKAWLETDKVRDFMQSRERIEVFLRASLTEIRDGILGDAVVLALRLPAGSADPAEARGLLLLKARDPGLLNRLIDLINAAQFQNGELAELVDHDRGGTIYHTRTFPAGGDRLAESFVAFPDGTFAFSNDERLIQEVVDRKAAAGPSPTRSVADCEDFRATSARLPARALARLFLEPSAARPLLDAAPAGLKGYLDGLDHVGAALIIDDHQIKVQSIQAFQPARFRESTRALVAEPSAERPETRLSAVPATAAAMISISVDVPMVYRLLVGLVPAADQPKIPKLEALASGLLLGLDPLRQVLPALGPRVVAYLEPPDLSAGAVGPPRRLFPLVAAVEINEEAAARRSNGDPTVASAVDNALTATLAALSLDEKRVPADVGVQAREVDGVAVKSLGAALPFAFAVDQPGRRLIVGSAPDAVARYVKAGADPRAGARFQAIRAAAFPDCDSFGCLDLAAAHRVVVQHRDRIIKATAGKQGRPAADVSRDLDQVLGIVQLFDAAFFTTRLDVDNAAIELAVGLLPRSSAEGAAAPGPPVGN